METSAEKPKLITINTSGINTEISLKCLGSVTNWWGFQTWDTLLDSTDDSCIDKVQTSLEWQEHLCRFQDTTDVLPYHIHFPVCLWIMDSHSRATKRNTSHANEVLPQDTPHLTQRPCYQRGSPCQDPAGNRANFSGMVMFPFHQVWPKPSRKAQSKGEEDKADRERGGKTTSANGQAWSSLSLRGQWRTGKNGGNWLQNYLWCPNDPRG